MTPDLKLFCLWLNLDRILDKGRGKMGVARRPQLKRSSLSEVMIKNVVRFLDFLKKKIGRHPSVAVPDDTNPIVTPLANKAKFLHVELSKH